MNAFYLLVFSAVLFVGCGGSSDTASSNASSPYHDDRNAQNTKFTHSYQGMQFYTQDLPISSYTLAQLDDEGFNALTESQKLHVADKLLSSLFFGYPIKTLKAHIDQGDFISALHKGFKEKKNDPGALESHINDSKYFYHDEYSNDEVHNILARFYSMKQMDSFYLNNYIAYILTQTIMFSPAYELESAHQPNSERVFNALVRNLQNNVTLSYGTYLHLIGSDNWRRFRSPEDNGREMLEIFALDFDDKKVPLAAKALQNWKLDSDSDTLVIGLNQNTTPLSIFGQTVYDGFDFYRALVTSKAFQSGVISRIVDFYFTKSNAKTKKEIGAKLLDSKPQSWHDIIVQILFSKAYLLESSQPKSAEETFFSLAKKMDYKHYNYTFVNFAKSLQSMHQASMKYKLGKLKRVPLDTLSFIHYHQYIRKEMMIAHVEPKKQNNYTGYGSHGWQSSFISDARINAQASDPKSTLHALVNHLFESTIARKANAKEMALFEKHFLTSTYGKPGFVSGLNLANSEQRANGAVIILDYISQLDALYYYKKVLS